jgi:hypothetical protein
LEVSESTTSLTGESHSDATAADASVLANLHELAEVFGNDLTAIASTGSNLFDFEPSLFGSAADAAATAAPADDFGLSSLGLEALAPGLDSLLNLF